MVFEVGNKEVTLYRGDDSYEIFKELKEHLYYNPSLYSLKRLSSTPQDHEIDLADIEYLRELLPYAERVSKSISNWLTYHINRQTNGNIYENKNYYGGNFGDTFIPAQDRKVIPPDQQHVIKLNRGRNKIVFPSGWFFEVFEWLRTNHRHTLRGNQTVNGKVYPVCVDLHIKNKLEFSTERTYTCGNGNLKDRQKESLDLALDLMTSRAGKFRSYMLWQLHIGWGKTYLAGAVRDNVKNPQMVFPINSKSLMLKSIPDYAGPMGYKVSVICADYMQKAIIKLMNSPVVESDDGLLFRLPMSTLNSKSIEVGDVVELKRVQKNIIPLNGHGEPVVLTKGDTFIVKELPYGMANITFGEFTDFTFVMVPTYMKRVGKDFDGSELAHYNMCVVDECNEHLSNECIAFYALLDVGLMIGMSGTPYGSPDQKKHILCTDIFGKPVLSEDLASGIAKKAVVAFDIEVYTNTNHFTDLYADPKSFPNIRSHVYLSKDRLLQLKQCLLNHTGESIFIYTGQADLEYGEMLESFLTQNGFQCKFINGSVKNSEYMGTLENFKRGNLPILISNRVLTSGENLNICSLMVMYYTGTNDRYIVQSIGRILRLFAGKERATVALFKDENAGRYSLNFQYQLNKYKEKYPDAEVRYR